MVALLALLIAGIITPTFGNYASADPSWPTSPPAAICGNTSLLSGPSVAPAGAVTVPAGDNSTFNFNQPGATFWFQSGTHTLANGKYAQITATSNSTYIGAPGAILDGQHANLYAFGGGGSANVTNVTIKYLTIKNFGIGNNESFDNGVVNHDAGAGWTVQYNTISNNGGAGVFLATDNVVSYNCLKDNGQYGFSMFKDPIVNDSSIKNIVLDHNEIAGNNTDNWEAQFPNCGCTGGGKFWDVKGATVTNNYVHDNKGTGLWADTNNIDFLFEGNYIDHNDGEGIWYEISYNATIRNNYLSRNAWVSGNKNQGSPGPAIYLSESGGESRLASTVSGAPKIRIYNNKFVDNFSGVSIYENANRFCNSLANTSTGYCTMVVDPTRIPLPHAPSNTYPNPVNENHPCYYDLKNEPYKTDCRWHAKNIEVNNNEFHFDENVVPCAGKYCGVQALIATGADNMNTPTKNWVPYTVAGIQNDVMFGNNNSFHDNKYTGNWRFAKGYGETISYNTWRAAPFNQDANSTFTGDSDRSGPNRAKNDLDANTAGLEGTIGKWINGNSVSISQSTQQAHGGTHSLRVDITGSGGWGVGTNNFPFATTPGVKKLSFWGKLGSGTNLQPKLTVQWLDSSNAVLQTNDATLPTLTNAWQKVSALVDVPQGAATALVALSGSGSQGDYFYLDDLFVGSPPNVLDADSAGGESSAGKWGPWFSATVAASTEEARFGNGSLRIDVTGSGSWGISGNNFPGFNATQGNKRVSFWAKQGTGSISVVKLEVLWFSGDGQTVLKEEVPVELAGLTTNWQQKTANLVAPSGTGYAYIRLVSPSGGVGNSLYVDDIVITDQ